MKKNSSRWLPLLILVFVSLFYLLPFLLFPAFNIIDDGASLLVSKKLAQDLPFSQWSTVLIEMQIGRFRPLYHLSFFAIYSLFGLQPFYFWLAQALMLIGTLLGMAIFLDRVIKSRWGASAAAGLLLLFSPVADNFYRLGTAEPKQMLIWVWLMVWLERVKTKGWSVFRILAGVLLFTLAVFMKETSFLFFGLIGMLLVWQFLFKVGRKTSQIVTSLGVTALFAGVVGIFFAFLPHAVGYSSSFKLSPHLMYARLLDARLTYAAVFFPMTLAVIATFCRFCWQIWLQAKDLRKWRSLQKSPLTKIGKIHWEEFFWPTVLLSQFIVMLFIGILPWQFQLPRYFYPVYIMGFMYIAVEIAAWKNYWEKLRKLSVNSQLILSSAVILFATLLQISVFQSGRVLSISSVMMWERWQLFLLSSSPTLFVLTLGVGVTLIRLALAFLFRTKPAKKFELTDFVWQAWALVTTIVVLAVSVLIWKYQWPRMLYTINVMVVLYFVSEALIWLDWSEQNWFKKIGIGPFISFFMVLFLLSFSVNTRLFNDKGMNVWPLFGDTISTMQNSFDTHQISYGLIQYLLHDIPPHTQVFVVGDDYEVIFEIGLYASNLQRQPIVIYTSNKQLVDDLQPQYPYLQLSANPLNDFLAAPSTASSGKVLIMRQKDWQILKETQPAVTATLKAQERWPAANFATIPDYANWMVVRER